jgi:hypothetical protein
MNSEVALAIPKFVEQQLAPLRQQIEQLQRRLEDLEMHSAQQERGNRPSLLDRVIRHGKERGK